MQKDTQQPHGTAVELPPGAPLVRITAGVGSPGQKTWNLRRPVTLIGSRRPANIVLRDRHISNAHCVIVNTGSDVLLKDLHTTGGTLCNKDRVDLTLLKDGDVIVVGDMRIQVAIQIDGDQADDSACGEEFVDPTRFPKPVTLHQTRTPWTWHIEEAVVLIGRHPSAAIRLDNEAVSTRHALLFRWGREAAIIDLGSRTKVVVNGEECTLAPLRDGDRLAIGPCILGVGAGETTEATTRSSTAAAPSGVESTSGASPGTHGESPSGGKRNGSPSSKAETGPGAVAAPRPVAPPSSLDALGLAGDPGEALDRIESQLGVLQRNIGDSWDRLNAWESGGEPNATVPNEQESNLTEREVALDAKDAALRGQLFDLTRYHEEIVTRERELAEQLARIQTEMNELDAARADGKRREAEFTQRADELKRREHVLAQRWSRLQSVTCPRCRKPVNVGKTNPMPPGP